MVEEKKVQLIVLALILVGVIVGGICFFTHSTPEESEPEGALSSESHSEVQVTSAHDPTATRYQFELVNVVEEQRSEPGSWWNKLYVDGDRLVCMQLEISKEYWMTVRDAATGEIVQEYTYDDMGDFQSAFAYALDGDAVWLLYIDDANEYYVRRIMPGKEKEELGQLENYPFQYLPDKFEVWENFLIIQGDKGLGVNKVVIYDLKTGVQKIIDDVSDFCIDGKGGIYYLSNSADGGVYLVKSALTNDKKLWKMETKQSKNIILQQLFFHPKMGLFSIARDTGRIDCWDTETGARRYTLFSVAEDTDLNYTDEVFNNSLFAIDSNFHVWLRYTVTDYHATPMTNICYTWEYAPCQPQTDLSDEITLTITAPYAPDAMSSSVHMYQGKHPEVQVEWDTQFVSRDDFTAHASQYAEQLTLRLMAGDVGDIMMLHGSALDVDAVLKTDVMTDLSVYLADCPFRKELEDSYLDALTRQDGSISALPVAIQPSYWIYNQTLAEKMGVSWDTDNITWSQVFDLAQQWQADGVKESVFWTSAKSEFSIIDEVLYSFLLENLDAFVMEDGSVNLHQDWLIKRLEQLARLQDSTQLYNAFDDYWWYSFEDSLIVSYSGADYNNLFGWLYHCKENCNVELRILPVPKGEKTGTRQGYAFAWGITEVSRQKDIAWNFLEFLVGRDGFVMDTYFTDTCLLNKTADQERAENVLQSFARNYNTETEDYERYYDELRASLDHPISRLVEPTGRYNAIGEPISQYLAGSLSLDEALIEAEENWERALAE